MRKKYGIFTFLLLLAFIDLYVFQIHILLGKKFTKLPVYAKQIAEIRSNVENTDDDSLKMNELPAFKNTLEFNFYDASTKSSMKNMIKRIENRIINLNAIGPTDNNRKNLPKCEPNSHNTGPVTVDFTVEDLKEIQMKYPEVIFGGWYYPPDCAAQHKVAIIVPYRNREQSLALFLKHMHPFLMKQKIEYGIYVIEQYGLAGFNRAMLFNVGFVESQRLRAGGWQCFVFHDVDLLPLDERNLYSCPRQPRHMSAAVDTQKYQLPYESLTGGVIAMNQEQFISVNGFSNKYFGWGGEDDDMYKRLTYRNYSVSRYPSSIARYKMLYHSRQRKNPSRYFKLSESENFEWDGLSNLDYERVQVSLHHLYTHIIVIIDDYNKSYKMYTPFSWKVLICVYFVAFVSLIR